jgi:hypothetical protein
MSRTWIKPELLGLLVMSLRIDLLFLDGTLLVSVVKPVRKDSDQVDQARYDDFVAQRQGLQPRSRSRGRNIERVPEEAS